MFSVITLSAIMLEVPHVHMLLALNINACVRHCHRICIHIWQHYLCFPIYSADTIFCYHVFQYSHLSLYYYARVSSRSPSSTFCIRRVHSLYKSFDIISLNFCVSYFLYVACNFLLRRRVSVGSVASMLRWVTLALACAMLLTIVSLDSGIV